LACIPNSRLRIEQERFASWYERPIDLPGRVYLQVVDRLFKQNQLVRGEYVALGKELSLQDVRCPVYLLAGDEDDITPAEQVFNAEAFLGTPKAQIAKTLAPGGPHRVVHGSPIARRELAENRRVDRRRHANPSRTLDYKRRAYRRGLQPKPLCIT
jgi:poly-beta-hydroxyalkanoate depolymerase